MSVNGSEAIYSSKLQTLLSMKTRTLVTTEKRSKHSTCASVKVPRTFFPHYTHDVIYEKPKKTNPSMGTTVCAPMVHTAQTDVRAHIVFHKNNSSGSIILKLFSKRTIISLAMCRFLIRSIFQLVFL